MRGARRARRSRNEELAAAHEASHAESSMISGRAYERRMPPPAAKHLFHEGGRGNACARCAMLADRQKHDMVDDADKPFTGPA